MAVDIREGAANNADVRFNYSDSDECDASSDLLETDDAERQVCL